MQKTTHRKPTPRTPDPDPALSDVLHLIRTRTPAEIAKNSNDLVSASTIYRWRKHGCSRPSHFTMTGALAAVGYRWKIVRDTK